MSDMPADVHAKKLLAEILFYKVQVSGVEQRTAYKNGV